MSFEFIKQIDVVVTEADTTEVESGNDAAKKANNTKDVSFSLMRNAINSNKDEIKMKDVADYLDRAHELNDEVDTIAFGLELSDGSVVKVYVNASESEGFEDACAEMLGKEDDVETAIEELAKEFDIVDVVWPDDENNEDDENTPNEDDESNEEETPEQKPNPDAADIQDSDDLDLEENLKMASIKSIFKSSIGEKVTESVLTSSRFELGNDFDIAFGPEGEKVLGLFSTRNQRRIAALIMLLGMPAEIILLKRGAFRQLVRNTAREYQQNGQLRSWSNRLIKALAPISGASIKEKDPELMDESSSVEDLLSTELQHTIFNVMVKLGVPESLMAYSKGKLRNAIRQTANLLKKHPRVKNYVNMTAEILGATADKPKAWDEDDEAAKE